MSTPTDSGPPPGCTSDDEADEAVRQTFPASDPPSAGPGDENAEG